MSGVFFDTNVLVYAFGTTDKAVRGQQLLAAGGVIGVQSLNEFTVVALRKLKMDWPTIEHGLAAIRVLCPTIVPLTVRSAATACASPGATVWRSTTA